jgi:organic hydroperoxide reductase OsmC/OhrA
MANYTAEVVWKRTEPGFLDNHYSRKHVLRFDGGIEVAGSSSPHVVPLPWSAPDAIDPEEMFIASLSSCHMLWFLAIASKRGFVVDDYHDLAEGVMAEDHEGRMMMTLVTLRPLAVFSGDKRPAPADIDNIHHAAHAECYIANSVKTEVRCEPRYEAV